MTSPTSVSFQLRFEAEKAKKSEKAKAQAGEAAKKAVKATISKEKKPKEDPKAKAKGELMAFSRGFWMGGIAQEDGAF